MKPASGLNCFLNHSYIRFKPCPWSKVVASLNLLFEGCHPEQPILIEGRCDHVDITRPTTCATDLGTTFHGTRIAGAVVELRGDWKFFKDCGESGGFDGGLQLLLLLLLLLL